jgi:uncharacterized membrane-anchored protein YhcB (DUF1043 family)
MEKKITYLLIAAVLLIVGVAIGYSIPVLQQKNADFKRYAAAREAAPDKEKFDADFENLTKWFDNYKKEHPGATDAEARAAFDALWNKK